MSDHLEARAMYSSDSGHSAAIETAALVRSGAIPPDELSSFLYGKFDGKFDEKFGSQTPLTKQ
jgi:hypothetical protein